MLLMLMRHGIAIDREDPQCPPEEDRHLTPEGRKRTQAAARGLAALKVKPDVLLSSPFVRAVQTAAIAAEALGVDPKRIKRTRALEPGAPPQRLLDELARVDAREVLCFGHAPNMDRVIAHALGCRRSITALKKAGVACLELDPPGTAQGRLVWLTTSAALRSIGG